MKKYSVIIPVYNRPDELRELLESLTLQTNRNFDVWIIEDGSTIDSKAVVDQFSDQLETHYFFKPNSGPGDSRNFGMQKATGEWFIIFDSDCLIPPHYFEALDTAFKDNEIQVFGGPDAAHSSFTTLQKAINYSMTSFFTTGGIRGGSEKMDKFYPRSFNMGYTRKVFETTKGFSKMRFGEDIDMSIRIFKNGFKTRLIKDAYVFHKRRTSLKQFFKQIYNSGIARINLYKKYPESLKLVHFAPAIFTLGLLSSIVLSALIHPIFISPIVIHLALLWIDSTIKNKSLTIGTLSLLTSYIQLTSYGLGFLLAVWKRIVLGKDEFSSFTKNFYK